MQNDTCSYINTAIIIHICKAHWRLPSRIKIEMNWTTKFSMTLDWKTAWHEYMQKKTMKNRIPLGGRVGWRQMDKAKTIFMCQSLVIHQRCLDSQFCSAKALYSLCLHLFTFTCMWWKGESVVRHSTTTFVSACVCVRAYIESHSCARFNILLSYHIVNKIGLIMSLHFHPSLCVSVCVRESGACKSTLETEVLATVSGNSGRHLDMGYNQSQDKNRQKHLEKWYIHAHTMKLRVWNCWTQKSLISCYVNVSQTAIPLLRHSALFCVCIFVKLTCRETQSRHTNHQSTARPPGHIFNCDVSIYTDGRTVNVVLNLSTTFYKIQFWMHFHAQCTNGQHYDVHAFSLVGCWVSNLIYWMWCDEP